MKNTIRIALLIMLGVVPVFLSEAQTGQVVRLWEDFGSKKTNQSEGDMSARKARVVVVTAVFAQEARSRFLRELAERHGLKDPSVLENPSYTTFFVDALVNTRKVDVLEREDLLSAVKELDFGESDYADTRKVARLGQVLNADYVVIPEIRYINLVAQEKDIPYIPQKQKRYGAKLATAVRVVDVRTSRVVSSNIKEVEVLEKVSSRDIFNATALSDVMSNVYRESAGREAAVMVDVAYPIRVMAVTGDEIVVNRGKGAIQVGERLQVFAQGEVMIDPDTKENLGYQETMVGLAEVAVVDLKTARAMIIKKDAEIKQHYPCRRAEAAVVEKQADVAPKID